VGGIAEQRDAAVETQVGTESRSIIGYSKISRAPRSIAGTSEPAVVPAVEMVGELLQPDAAVPVASRGRGCPP
jgi:hypothetical protein